MAQRRITIAVTMYTFSPLTYSGAAMQITDRNPEYDTNNAIDSAKAVHMEVSEEDPTTTANKEDDTVAKRNNFHNKNQHPFHKFQMIYLYGNNTHTYTYH